MSSVVKDDAASGLLCSFEAKKMRRYVSLIVMGILWTGCGLQETGEHPKAEDVWTGPGYSVSEDGLEGEFRNTVWYVTGFDYPSGYDWRADADAGAVKCSLTVFANAVPMLKVPVGEQHRTRPDPDMHRMIDGCLYTEYAADSLTMIRRNGKPLFEYAGEEKIIGMLEDEGNIYTLGQAVSGNGFSYRVNGKKLVSRDRGYVFGHFVKDSAGHCFAFSEPILSVSGEGERYYVCIGGKVSQIAVREDVKKVWDVMFSGGKMYYIASLVGVDAPVLVDGDHLAALELSSPLSIRSCRFIPGSTGPYIDVLIDIQGFAYMSAIWKDGKFEKIFPLGSIVAAICAEGDGIYAVLTSAGGTGGLIYRCGETFDMPEGYTILSTDAISVVNGIMHVGLSSLTGGRPVIWRDGEMETLRLNGYIATVTSVQASHETMRD